ncbi:MAG: squalene/phytoene synthase family protein [Rhodobacteraceae bacterium]|nr:squalene/phytoene synthase family protein [Paracoccaceae bacterium]
MSLQACADLVARADPDRFLATMAAPVPARRVLFPIYAFNVEVARAPWVASEPPIAEIRMQWWREVLEEIAASGTVRAHEVTTPLADALDPTGAAVLDRLIGARRWDVYSAPFEDEAHFSEYLDATAGGLTWVSARALGALPPGAEPVVRDAGWAAGLAGFLRAVPELWARGRQPLLDDGDAALKALADQGLDRLSRATAQRAVLPRTAAPALLAGWQTRQVLTAARSDPGRVRDGRLELSAARKRLLLIRRSMAGW